MNISIEGIKDYVKNKAIVPVHLFGRAAIWKLLWLLPKNITYVIEDNAQRLVPTVNFRMGLKKAGTIGHVGATSFPF
jgi:dTDP-4-amino-4,6-dideoxygalactose transaminase